jgi:hypothetical protein
MLSHGALIERCLALSPAVRYVAVYVGGVLKSRERAGLAGASAAESDRYEELLVNPTMLTLLGQRGNIDCGGLRYVVIRYGNFYQCVFPVAGGHVSVAVEINADLGRHLEIIEDSLAEWAGAP